MAAAPTVLPVKAAGVVSITFESTAPHLDLQSLDLRTVRTHLNGESSFIAALADGLIIHALASYVEADGDGRWKPLRTVPVAQAGFDKNDALLEYPWKSHPAYRPLAEYFGFSEKHDFVDIDLGAILATAGACRRVTLHVALKEGHGNPHAARLLNGLSATHFRLFSTPVVNLFHRLEIRSLGDGKNHYSVVGMQHAPRMTFLDRFGKPHTSNAYAEPRHRVPADFLSALRRRPAVRALLVRPSRRSRGFGEPRL